MESRIFIRQANALIKKIEAGVDDSAREGVQKEITSLFIALLNPTLMTAGRLRDAALKAEFTVSPQVQHKLEAAESCWNG